MVPKHTQEQLIYSRGAPPPGNGKPLTWKLDTFEEPSILRITLKPIYTIPAVKDTLTPSKFSNLKIAMKEYCQKLLAEGLLTSCDLPSPDPQLPTPRYDSV